MRKTSPVLFLCLFRSVIRLLRNCRIQIAEHGRPLSLRTRTIPPGPTCHRLSSATNSCSLLSNSIGCIQSRRKNAEAPSAAKGAPHDFAEDQECHFRLSQPKPGFRSWELEGIELFATTFYFLSLRRSCKPHKKHFACISTRKEFWSVL
jgi:hypothetical protein